MIQLTLSAFRCYDQTKTLTFHSDEISRILGSSGIGKTTLLDAIQWVLYNYPTTNIYPRHGRSKNTQVILSLPWKDGQLKIDRKKNPGLLVVTHTNGLYEEDDVAQGTLNRLFGSRDIWRVCSYLPQDEYCPLLGFSNNQRMEIVETLAFIDENPDEDIAKIGQEVSRLQDRFKQAAESLSRLTVQKFTLPGRPEDYIVPMEIRAARIREVESVSNQIKCLNKDEIIAKERHQRRTCLEERLRRCKSDLDMIDVTPDDVTSYLGHISILQKELSFSRQDASRTNLETQIDGVRLKLSSLPIPDRDYSELEYQTAALAERKIAEERKTLVQYTTQVSYNPEQVKDRCDQIKARLAAQKGIQTWGQIKKLRSALNSIEASEMTQRDLDMYRDELSKLEQSEKMYKCPSCQRSLRFTRNDLVLSETSPVSPDKIEMVRRNVRLAEKAIQQNLQREMIHVQINSLLSTTSGPDPNEVPLSKSETDRLEVELLHLQRLVFPAAPRVESQMISKYRSYTALRTELDLLEQELGKHGPLPGKIRSVDVITTALRTCQSKLNQCQEQLGRKEALQTQIKLLQQDILSLKTIDLETLHLNLDKATSRLKELERDIDHDSIATAHLQSKVKYDEQEKIVIALTKELSAAERLNDLARQEICDILDEKIATINSSITDVCSRLFREPITIELAMTKTTKTTKVIKPCIHLRIWHKDGEHDSLSTMSGGEKRRVSLAVSLALSQLNSFPLLLLDECLNGLDEELKEVALDLFHEMTGKTLLCVMHDGTTGTYDHLVNLDFKE